MGLFHVIKYPVGDIYDDRMMEIIPLDIIYALILKLGARCNSNTNYLRMRWSAGESLNYIGSSIEIIIDNYCEDHVSFPLRDTLRDEIKSWTTERLKELIIHYEPI